MSMLSLKNHADIAFSYAPGKIILVGEHAVVYGARAIALPIKTGLRVAVLMQEDQNEQGPFIRGVGQMFLGEASRSPSGPGPQILKSALNYLAEAFGAEVTNLAIVVDGNLPPGRGLGSSAALSVALIRGIHRYFSRPLTEDILNQHALALETIFHGSPSGLDHTVIIGERVIGFKKESDGAKVWPIRPKSTMRFVISAVGPHDGTKNAVRELRERKKRHEEAYARIFSGLDAIALEMEIAIERGEHASVGELMNMAQGYLNALSLSTPAIEKLCAIARESGALGAKLTGAGGGGAVIALSDGNEEDIMKAFKAAGYQSFVTEVLDESLSTNGGFHL